MQSKAFSFRITTLAILIILVTASCGALKPSLKGGVISPPIVAADINLTDHNGQPFELSKFRGKVALVFFGFSNCVDECPATMAIIKQALSTLGGDASKDVVVVMVSTDPANDTPGSMKEFMGRFSPDFLGLLGTPEQLAKSWQDYGVTVLDGGETHSSFTYVVDKKGNLRETFSPDTTSDDIAADIKILLAEN
jgi:protein SCO1/2